MKRKYLLIMANYMVQLKVDGVEGVVAEREGEEMAEGVLEGWVEVKEREDCKEEVIERGSQVSDSMDFSNCGNVDAEMFADSIKMFLDAEKNQGRKEKGQVEKAASEDNIDIQEQQSISSSIQSAHLTEEAVFIFPLVFSEVNEGWKTEEEVEKEKNISEGPKEQQDDEKLQSSTNLAESSSIKEPITQDQPASELLTSIKIDDQDARIRELEMQLEEDKKIIEELKKQAQKMIESESRKEALMNTSEKQSIHSDISCFSKGSKGRIFLGQKELKLDPNQTLLRICTSQDSIEPQFSILSPKEISSQDKPITYNFTLSKSQHTKSVTGGISFKKKEVYEEISFGQVEERKTELIFASVSICPCFGSKMLDCCSFLGEGIEEKASNPNSKQSHNYQSISDLSNGEEEENDVSESSRINLPSSEDLGSKDELEEAHQGVTDLQKINKGCFSGYIADTECIVEISEPEEDSECSNTPYQGNMKKTKEFNELPLQEVFKPKKALKPFNRRDELEKAQKSAPKVFSQPQSLPESSTKREYRSKTTVPYLLENSTVRSHSSKQIHDRKFPNTSPFTFPSSQKKSKFKHPSVNSGESQKNEPSFELTVESTQSKCVESISLSDINQKLPFSLNSIQQANSELKELKSGRTSGHSKESKDSKLSKLSKRAAESSFLTLPENRLLPEETKQISLSSGHGFLTKSVVNNQTVHAAVFTTDRRYMLILDLHSGGLVKTCDLSKICFTKAKNFRDMLKMLSGLGMAKLLLLPPKRWSR